MNKMEEVNYNNNDHLAKLEIFFQKKIDQDKINRKIKNNKKVSKKQRQNPHVFEFDSKQFRLVDKNGVASVSTPRIPKKNSFLSNLSKGGKAININLTNVEKIISKKIAKDLKKENIFFAGIDFIDQKLNGDINVTSPTGLKTLYDLSKINLAKTFWKKLRT